MLSGVNYIVQYTGGLDIEGQCIEQQPGKTISLLTNKNLTEVINVDKITKQRIVPVNPNQTLYQQSCLTDVVMLKNGSTVKGIITETNYGQKDADNNIVILNENNIPQMLMIKDIVEYRKTPNKEYKPVFDKMLPVGDILINGNKVCFTDVKEEQINNNRVIVLQSDTCKMSFKLDTLKNNIIVEANFGAETPDISLLPANKYVQKKTSFIGFSYEDLVKKSIPSTSIETSINKTTKIIFPIKKPGLYLIYFNKKNRVVFFDIK
jgi:small nuclear ribonucleoprotein (snRNP)-like protein